jgi:hypothetical protein
MAATRGHAAGRNARASGRGQRPAAQESRRATGGPTSGDLAAYKARLREVIEPLARSAGYDLEDLSVVRMGRRHVVRVTVDRDGGVGLDAVAELSRDISHGLDDAESADLGRGRIEIEFNRLDEVDDDDLVDFGDDHIGDNIGDSDTEDERADVVSLDDDDVSDAKQDADKDDDAGDDGEEDER